MELLFNSVIFLGSLRNVVLKKKQSNSSRESQFSRKKNNKSNRWYQLETRRPMIMLNILFPLWFHQVSSYKNQFTTRYCFEFCVTNCEQSRGYTIAAPRCACCVYLWVGVHIYVTFCFTRFTYIYDSKITLRMCRLDFVYYSLRR